MVVAIERIKEYDRNPRHECNTAYEAIRASLHQRGFTGALPITQRPGEAEYRAAEGGNTVLRILKELYAETSDPRYATIHCLFEPWISESETLIAHLVENDARSELLLIDRARALREIQGLLEQEIGAPLSANQLATLLRDRGYAIDQPTIGRLEYAVETLFPVIPMALRAGMGRPAIDQIRRLERTFVKLLEHRAREADIVEEIQRWFRDCLTRHDREDWVLEPVQRELEAHIAQVLGESLAKVRADFDFIERYGAPGEFAPPPAPFSKGDALERPARTLAGTPSPSVTPHTEAASERKAATPVAPKARAAGVEEARDADRGFASQRGEVIVKPIPAPRETPAAPVVPLTHPEPPTDLKSLRHRMMMLAAELAERSRIGECILPCPKGCGFVVDLPSAELYAGDCPESAEETRRVSLWWMLSALSEQWPYGTGAAPALPYLENARIYPAILGVVNGDERTAQATVIPRVSDPPSLDIASRQLFAVIDDADFALLIRLFEIRRVLQSHCRRLGKKLIWEI